MARLRSHASPRATATRVTANRSAAPFVATAFAAALGLLILPLAAQAQLPSMPGGDQAALISSLTGSTGVSSGDATAGVGALMGVAQQNLSADEGNQLAAGIPGMDSFLEAGAGAFGDMGGAASAIGAASAAGIDIPGVGNLGQAAALTSAFSKLGLDPALIVKFVPPVLDFASKMGGTETLGLLKKGLDIV